MLIYVAVLTKFVIRIARITCVTLFGLLFLITSCHRFFFICRYRQCFRIHIPFMLCITKFPFIMG